MFPLTCPRCDGQGWVTLAVARWTTRCPDCLSRGSLSVARLADLFALPETGIRNVAALRGSFGSKVLDAIASRWPEVLHDSP